MLRKTIVQWAIPFAVVISAAGLASAASAPRRAAAVPAQRTGSIIKHADEAEATTPEAAVSKLCQGCHDTQLVMDTPKSYDEWTESVHDMLNRGGLGTPAEVALVMQYLHANITAIDVNHATAEDLHIILDATDEAVKAIIDRRNDHPFKDLADLETIPGIDKDFVEAKKRMIYFQ